MVNWVVNDLSLEGQYSSVSDWLEQFSQLLAIRKKFSGTGHELSCARDLRYRLVSDTTTLSEALHYIENQPLRNLALAWLTKGPFWTSNSEARGINYFHIEDVTNQGLGEAARRRWLGEDARSFSFSGLAQFEVHELDVQSVREESNLEEISKVPNAWLLSSLTNVTPVTVPSRSWEIMIDEAVSKLTYIQISRDQAIQEMSRYPYDKGADKRLFGLLKRLDDIAHARITYGDSSEPVKEWLRVNVMVANADFSSEEPINPAVFTFKDPDTGEYLYCPWHGKVHNPLQYRIHYQWPMPQGQSRLKVLYIGQKITKS
ncbi:MULTISPECIES: hypothetical protein [Gluconobacter]|uniref:Uncharacterized protein n=2 Tax=Gluconobacter TaxID=441 RepID=A0A829WNT4_GLUOY|nr:MULTISPECIES: hypothetical protein [Gluconobacter]QEH97972.1 hypothetical protein FXF46_16940 [Gluconobacter thailandicus]GEM18468.1 hypothetical protein NBRC3293_2965 [Gluconobacter oxydans NBRC 3293]GEM18590.1 hypothetical protein NBRC3293_3087 [Gluconobacter oxydans NBRC 3293]